MGGWKQALAVGLSALSGFVDGLGYVSLGGVFVAFMSGNSTVLGVGVAEGMSERTGLAAGLVAAFVAGVVAGAWLGRRMGVRRASTVLATMAGILAVAALVQGGGWVRVAGLLAAAAMGMENTVFQEPGKPGVGLTYMTGTLVRIGTRLSEGRMDGALAFDALLWGGMVVGAGLGAWVHGFMGFGGLWLAVVPLLVLAGLMGRVRAVS